MWGQLKETADIKCSSWILSIKRVIPWQCTKLQFGCEFTQNVYTVASQKYAHPPFPLKVIAKGHLLLESTPTQQNKIICSSINGDEICSVHVYIIMWASSWSGRNQGTVRSDHSRLVLARDTTAQDAQNRGLCQTHAASPTLSSPTLYFREPTVLHQP